jgi:ribonuclease P protein component
MISSKYRFHGYNSLRFAYTKGQTVRGPLFAVKSALNPRRRSYRVAVVVSRKVHKSAVARNRMRRRLYELIRELETEIEQPYDVVITVFHDGVLLEPHKSLRRQLHKQLKEAGILKKL